MPGQNDFKAFAAGGGANALTPSAWATLTALIANGFQAGTASSAQVNTVLRQVSTMAAALGSIISAAEMNAVDDGNVTVLSQRLLQALATLQPANMQARAWVTFTSSGSILSSRNVSSVTKTVTGVYTITFAPGTFTSGDYVPAGMCGAANGVSTPTGSSIGEDNYLTFGWAGSQTVKTESAIKVYSVNKDTNTLEDSSRICIAFFGA